MEVYFHLDYGDFLHVYASHMRINSNNTTKLYTLEFGLRNSLLLNFIKPFIGAIPTSDRNS